MDNTKEILEQLYHLNNLILENIENNSETKENNSKENNINNSANTTNTTKANPLQNSVIDLMSNYNKNKQATTIYGNTSNSEYIVNTQTPVIVFDTYIPESKTLHSAMFKHLTYTEYKVLSMLLNIYKYNTIICLSYAHAYFFSERLITEETGITHSEYINSKNHLIELGILISNKVGNRYIYTFDFDKLLSL